MSDNVTSVLNDLVETSRDGEQGFRTAAEDTKSPELRTVFLARCMTDPSRVRRRESLAAELGVSRERIYQLEVSAKRKIAVALAQKALPAVLDPPNPRALRCAVTVS